MLGLKFFKLLARKPLAYSLNFAYTAKTKPPAEATEEPAHTEAKPQVKSKKPQNEAKSQTKDAKSPKNEKNKPKEQESQQIKEKSEKEEDKKKDDFELSKTSELALDRFRKMKQKFSVTKDQFRVDVGLVIDRPPIFLNLSDKEMQYLKYRTALEKKYKIIPPVPKDLADYPLEKFGARLPVTPENKATHMRDLDDGTEEYYCEHSKVFFEVDPTVTKQRSIQRAANYRVYLLVKNKETNEWEFPSFVVLESEKFEDARMKFFRFLSNDIWKINYFPVEPFVWKAREFTAEEKKDPRNKKLNGVKIFYFAASHKEGVVEINDKLYSDFAWTTKLEANQYLTRENYKTFIHSLALY